LQIADRIEAEAEAFGRLEALNCGKPVNAAIGDEIPAIVDCFRFFAGAVRTLHGPVAGEYLEGHTSMIRRDPIGVVASIAPWNYPLMMMAWKLAPALAGGNTVVFKPSEQTPLTALKLARIMADVLPEGGRQRHPRARRVGGQRADQPRSGRHDLADRRRGHRQEDASGGSAQRQAHASGTGRQGPRHRLRRRRRGRGRRGLKVFGYYNAGQDCTAACRVYASDKTYDRLVADLTSAVESIAYARADDAENEIGPLISLRQRDRVASFVERARELPHVEITTGGAAHGDNGFYYRPTVVAGAMQEDEIVQREVFGPVVSRHPLLRSGSGGRLGQRFALRPGLVDLDARRGPGDGDGRAAALWLHLGEHAFHAGQRDAAWRAEAVGLWQGHVGLRAGGLHRGAPRDGQARLKRAGHPARRAI
jgi:aminobutyraldehyde dehydrogenase